MTNCPHSATDADTAYADGLCAYCMLDKINALRSALKDCADDLEASVKAEYRDVLDYPSMKRKYERDMEPVIKARKLLA